jgi:hypothetical protein
MPDRLLLVCDLLWRVAVLLAIVWLLLAQVSAPMVVPLYVLLGIPTDRKPGSPDKPPAQAG